MQKVYYTRMTKTHAFTLTVLLMAVIPSIPLASGIAPQSASTAKPLTTSALDSHDGLTVGADPWLSAERYKSTFPKKSPYAAGVLAIKVTFRNDTAESIRVGLDRIRLNLTLDENNRQNLPALSSEQLADAVLHPKIKASKSRLPIPIPTSQGGRDKNWLDFQKLAEDASLHASVIAPHSSVDGLLYFDLQSQFDLLSNAHLYIPELVALETSRELMYFDIDLSRPVAH